MSSEFLKFRSWTDLLIFLVHFTHSLAYNIFENLFKTMNSWVPNNAFQGCVIALLILCNWKGCTVYPFLFWTLAFCLLKLFEQLQNRFIYKLYFTLKEHVISQFYKFMHFLVLFSEYRFLTVYVALFLLFSFMISYLLNLNIVLKLELFNLLIYSRFQSICNEILCLSNFCHKSSINIV